VAHLTDRGSVYCHPLLNALKKLVPRTVKRRIRLYQESRLKARLFGDLAPLVPPVAEMFEGPGSLEEFKANGEEYLRIYREICGLRPGETMLDVGSGLGRKTLPLTRYLNEHAVYEGIDISKAGVEWCRETIGRRFPRFRFQQIDVYNQLYNPLGRYRPAEYTFPFADGTFTFVVLGSVFTHMRPADVTHYLSEVHRVLARGGRCLISYFLLDDESSARIAAGRSALAFPYTLDGFRTSSLEIPEQAVAFDERFVRELYGGTGLKIVRVHHGSWCGRETSVSYQDLILAVKE
jgi:SAM-dependent methyltransferase